MDRPLSPIETQAIRVSLAYHEARSTKAFSWKGSIIFVLVTIAFWVLDYYLPQTSLLWLCIASTFSLIFYWWNALQTWQGERKSSQTILPLLRKTLEAQSLTLEVYDCQQALFFGTYEDEGDLYALEVGEKQLLFLWDVDYSNARFLPNSKFEIVSDPELALALGWSLRVLGKPFTPISVNPQIKWDSPDLFPAHGEIRNESALEFLKRIEEHFQQGK